MITHVRVDHPDGFRWVTNPNATGPRREAVLSVSDRLSDADLDRRAIAFMATRENDDSISATPVSGPTAGTDFVTGDWVTIDGTKQRVVDVKYRMDTATGELLPAEPTFATRQNVRLADADRAFDRLIALQAGGGVDASILADQTLMPVEAQKSQSTISWSWYDGADPGSRDVLDDDSRWQVHRVEEPARCAAITVTADWAGATGNTVLELHRNGSLWDGLWNVTLTSGSGGFDWRIVWMWGYSYLNEGDMVTIRASSNGQHRQGKYELHLWPTI